MDSINNFKADHAKYKKSHQAIVEKYKILINKLSGASNYFDKCCSQKINVNKEKFSQTISELTQDLELARLDSLNLTLFLKKYMDSIMDLYNDKIIDNKEYIDQMTSICEKIESVSFNCIAIEKGINGLKQVLENL